MEKSWLQVLKQEDYFIDFMAEEVVMPEEETLMVIYSFNGSLANWI